VEHGQVNYDKGLRDAAAKVLAVLDDPNPAWGQGELARAVRAAIGQ